MSDAPSPDPAVRRITRRVQDAGAAAAGTAADHWTPASLAAGGTA